MERVMSAVTKELCGESRFDIISIAKDDILKSTDISTSQKEMEVLDEFLFRCYQMGWLNKYAEMLWNRK